MACAYNVATAYQLLGTLCHAAKPEAYLFIRLTLIQEVTTRVPREMVLLGLITLYDFQRSVSCE